MAENQSAKCLMTEQQVLIANILFSSLSFSSFIFGLVSAVLNRLCYYRYKNKYPVDPTEGIFFLALVAIIFLELVDSFQWLVLFRSVISCTVLGAVREYAMISILVTLMCLGIHMIILITHPKCLQVIKEEKQKRYKLLQRSYVFAAFLVPILFVPWPFIEEEYGKDEYLCWLSYNCSASNTTLSYVLVHLLMWHFWAVLAWIFAVVMLVLAIYRYCTHKSASKSNPSHNVCTLIPLLLTFITVITANALLFIWELITREFSLPITVLTIVTTPLMLVLYVFTIMIRSLKIIKSKSNDIASKTIASVPTYETSYGATHFILPDDEWN